MRFTRNGSADPDHGGSGVSGDAGVGLSVACAAEEKAPPPQPLTTSDPENPVAEPALLLKPLAKDELLVEVDGWQALLKAKAEERTQLIDHIKAALDELETKTDKDDADTLAKIKDHRLDITSVTGITLDVKDTTSAWVAIQGWPTSEEGGLRWAKNIVLFVDILSAVWILSNVLSRAVHRGLQVSGRVSKLLEDFLVGAVRWIVMAVIFICRPWARTADYWDVYWDVTKAVKQRFDAEGIGIPFPQRDVHLYVEGGPANERLSGVVRGRTGSGGANPQPLEPDDDRAQPPCRVTYRARRALCGVRLAVNLGPSTGQRALGTLVRHGRPGAKTPSPAS